MRSHLAFKGPVHTLFVGTHRTIFCFDSIPTPPALHFVGLVSHLIDSYEVYNVEPLRRPRQVRPLQSDPDDVCLSPLQNIGVLPTTDVGTDDFMSDDQQTLPLDNWNGLTPNESRVLGLFPPGDFDVLTKTLLRVLKSCRSHIRQFKTYWDLSAGKQLFKLTAGELPAKEVHQLKRMSFHVDAPDLTCLEDVLTDLGYVLLTRKRKTTLQFRQGGSDSRVK
ncbi:MAG: hypothetical protein KVP17_005353, partial [Porospora cf. gigantea B]|uniref:uncharacterized protein n=1 Tax=Porospora cf. gigantea B TaxID=2853592 RepID=UPI0035719F5A